MAETRHSVNAAELLRTSRDRQVSLRLQLALDQRLDALVERAIDAGERTTRAEILQALVLDCELDGAELGDRLRHLRTATCGDAVLDHSVPDDNVLQFLGRKPGPRTRRA
nr:hypothetical protein PCFP31_470 [Curtobacterium flaccumfaciens pv. poinsettiae]